MKSFLNSMSSSAVNSQIAPTPQLKKKPADDSSGTPVTGNNNNPDRFCSICQASFNNPLMAQQHYVGKKHRKQMTKLKLMETYGPSTAPGPIAEAWVCAVLFCFFKKTTTKLSICNKSTLFEIIPYFSLIYSFHNKWLSMHHLQHWTELCGAVSVTYQRSQA